MQAVFKSPLVLLLLLFFVHSPQAAGQDVPARGASFFDSMQDQIGLSYDGRALPLEPHPFAELLRKLNRHAPFFTSVVPFGRSLQKMAAYPEALRFPRVLVTTGEQSKSLNTHFRGRLFIAYVEAAKKLEVISYNPSVGRFEFQIVDNFYPGGKARSRYMPRATCLRCHQGGTPIFAGGEWLETTAFNPELLKLTEAAIGSQEYFGIPLSRDGRSSQYDAVPKPEHFEDMVRFSALLIGYQKAWQDICARTGEPGACKQKLIAWMLLTNLFEKISLEPDRDLVQAFVSVLGQGTIDLPSEQLPDHNPIVEGQLSFHMPAAIDPSLPRAPMQMIMPSAKDPYALQFYKFHIFVKSMGQSFFTEKDFAHLRSILGGKVERRSTELTFQKQSYRVPQLGREQSCFPDPDVLLQGLGRDEETKLAMPWACLRRGLWLKFSQAIDSLKLTADAPLSREEILEKLAAKWGSTYAQRLCCKRAGPRLPGDTEDKPRAPLDPALFKDKRLLSFSRFCSECHLHQDLPPPFLAGASEEEILQNIRSRARLIKFRLEDQQMPPHFAQRALTAQERQELLRDLKKIAE